MDDDTRTALAILAGHAVSLFLFDAWLIHTGRRPISSVVRESPVARRLVRGLALHATETVDGDPLSALSTLLARRHATPKE